MKNLGKPLLGLGVALPLLAAACAASTPVGPVAVTPVPPPRATVAPPTGAPTPTLPLPGASPTPFAGTPPVPAPGPAGIPVEESLAVSALLRDTVKFGHQLQGLANGSPTASDLVQMSRRMGQTIGWVRQEIGGMTGIQREQTLRSVGYLLEWTCRVVGTYMTQAGGAGPTAAGGTPRPTAGTLLTILPGAAPTGPPSGLPSLTDQMLEQIALIQQDAARLSEGRPTGDDIVVLLTSLQASATTLRQQASLLSPRDTVSLMAAMEAAMQEVARAVERYAGT